MVVISSRVSFSIPSRCRCVNPSTNIGDPLSQDDPVGLRDRRIGPGRSCFTAVQNVTSQLLRMNLPGAQPTLQITLVVTALGIGISLFSALFPALAAARITPMEALHPEAKIVYEQATRRAPGSAWHWSSWLS